MGENAGETLRSFELPVLHENSTPLQYGDWLSLVDSLMGDLFIHFRHVVGNGSAMQLR